MNTKPLLLSILLLSLFGRGTANSAPQTDTFIESLRQLSPTQLQDTADYYFRANSYDTALMVYSVITETPVKENDIEQKNVICNAYFKSGVIYDYMYEYETAYDFYLKALDMCGDDSEYDKWKKIIYTNIGNIYLDLKNNDLAKFYFLKSLALCKDTASMIIALNNLGVIFVAEKSDSALFLYNEALQLSKRYNNLCLDAVTNGIARIYKETRQYDTAHYYFHLSLNESRRQNNIRGEVINLSNLGALFFEIQNMDSASYYLYLSNILALDNHFQHIAVENDLLLSKIEMEKGNIEKSLEYHLRSTHLNDSLFNASKLGNINQLQYDYDFAKINKQLEELKSELQTKQRTIKYQLTFWIITIIVLLSVIGIFFFFYRQRKKKKNHKQPSSCPLSEEAQKELLNNIMTFMERNTSTICDVDFNIQKLAKSTNSYRGYVSHVINKHLNKNFSRFVNEYRIKESKRLLSIPDTHIYTIETISREVGFKSQSSFNKVFKEITGITPTQYLKSISKNISE